ncbi:MAG: protein phosphatase 2C domain-containing protein [Muribaculaceae bacterium]|nr:protein phosphatase 2C domain-containing protein [Muribaculaceae bacterium]
MIRIRKPLSFTEIGRKDNQEDYLYPSNADENTRVFILCDGMGGHDNGEVASRTAGNALGDYLSSCSVIDIPVFETGLAKAYDALDNIDTISMKKPGTTMTCLCLNEDNYLVAHIGDSRIYHIRPSLYNAEIKRGGILYQSSDHSLVNDLLKAGELTEEEARNFPQKNVITRAMQPHLSKRYKADVYIFDDIQDGDYFFLCCDGVLEQLSNNQLCKILADRKLDDQQKLAAIKSVCDGKTRDNYSCWLIPIDKVSVKVNSGVSHVIQAHVEGNSNANIKQILAIPTMQSLSKLRKVLNSKISLPTNLHIHKLSLKTVITWILELVAILIVIYFVLKAFHHWK